MDGSSYVIAKFNKVISHQELVSEEGIYDVSEARQKIANR